MKKHLLFLCSATILIVFSSSAQVIFKKDRLFGASAGISFYNSNQVPNPTNQEFTDVALIPSIAWAIKDNVVAGIKARFSYSRNAGSYGDKTVQTSLQMGPEVFIRKYKLLANSFGLTFQHAVNGYYSQTKTKNGQVPDSKNKTWGGGYNFTPGAFYKFSDRFLGEANFGGLFFNYNVNYDRKYWSVAANFLTYFNIGIQYIIPAKKA